MTLKKKKITQSLWDSKNKLEQLELSTNVSTNFFFFSIVEVNASLRSLAYCMTKLGTDPGRRQKGAQAPPSPKKKNLVRKIFKKKAWIPLVFSSSPPLVFSLGPPHLNHLYPSQASPGVFKAHDNLKKYIYVKKKKPTISKTPKPNEKAKNEGKK